MNTPSETLRADFGGAIIEPGDAGYPSARRSALVVGNPAWVLRPSDARDVQRAVRFAAESGLPLSVRGGGHSFAGFGTNDGGVVIDLGELADVQLLDAGSHTVRVGGGATWGQVADRLDTDGLAISSGDTRSVGVGGLTLSGGIGWKVRKHGLALDNLTAVELVTASGDLLRASADEEPDLFWAVRGGGGNVGVVTAFEFTAHPTTEVFFGKIAFPAEETAAVLRGWADHMRSAPEELTSVLNFANPFAGGPTAPVEVHVAWDGDDPEPATAALDAIRALGTVIEDDVSLRPYSSILEEGGELPEGFRIATRSGFVDRESVPDVLGLLAAMGSREHSPFLSIRSLGGAVARVGADATAYAHRRAELMFVAISAGPEAQILAATPALDAAWAELAPHLSGAYANFLASDTRNDVDAVYPDATYRRLAAIKGRVDPGNLFAGNHNVQPA